ncbi:MAG TPA: hypothetical protein VET83_05450, partial [Candidatus Dormibacteraeota bacterium]|nr:hypothetical protein [Candidatus Dormibacteraeota bacterium]
MHAPAARRFGSSRHRKAGLPDVSVLERIRHRGDAARIFAAGIGEDRIVGEKRYELMLIDLPPPSHQIDPEIGRKAILDTAISARVDREFTGAKKEIPCRILLPECIGAIGSKVENPGPSRGRRGLVSAKHPPRALCPS